MNDEIGIQPIDIKSVCNEILEIEKLKMSEAKQHKRAIGYIDAIYGDLLYGWFHLPGTPKAELSVFADGYTLKTRKPIIASRFREDVTEQYGIDGNCGFKIPLRKLPKGEKRVSQISLRHLGSNFDFHQEKLSFCPLVATYADKLRQIFLPEYYRFRYGHESLSNEQALTHYLQFGIYEGFDPNPWFSSEYVANEYAKEISDYDLPIIAYLALESTLRINASEVFNTSHYARANARVVRTSSYLQHYVQVGHKEGLPCFPNPVPDYLGRELLELSIIEPDLEHVGEKINNVVRYPFLTSQVYIPKLMQRRFSNRPSVVMCLPFLSLGGSDLIATFLLKALEAHYGVDEVLMIVTDRCEHGVSKWVDTESNIVFLDENQSVNDLGDRIDLLHSVIGYLAPKKIINVNSNACWGMYYHYGKQLSQVLELNAYLFCFDYDLGLRKAGYIRDYVPETIKYMTHVFCDNETVIEEIRQLYGFADKHMAKFHTVYVPMPENLSSPDIEHTAKIDKPILWIGRLARQKRPELLLEIARRMKNHEFVAYGPVGDSDFADQIVDAALPNIEYRGVYTSFDELDLSEFSFYLNTSAWEGLPTMIIQLMSAGLPILTSRAGGIGELVSSDTGWLVPHDGDPESYVTEIRQLFLHSEIARKRARVGKELAEKRHSWGAFVARLEEVGCFSELSNSPQLSIVENQQKRAV